MFFIVLVICMFCWKFLLLIFINNMGLYFWFWFVFCIKLFVYVIIYLFKFRFVCFVVEVVMKLLIKKRIKCVDRCKICFFVDLLFRKYVI